VQPNSDRVNELARRAAGETNSAKLLALVAELNEALDQQREPRKGNEIVGTPHSLPERIFPGGSNRES